MNRLAFVVIFLVFLKFGYGQITSVVIDGIQKVPLNNANVTLVGFTDSLFKKSLSTNKNGAFSLLELVQGKYVLNVSYIGYTTYSAIVDVENRDKEIVLDTIRLLPQKKVLQDIVVNGKLPAIEFSPNKITLNVMQSPILSTGTVYDAITTVPGVIEKSNKLFFKGKKVLVLIDNKNTHLDGEDLKEMLSNLNANNIEKIEVLPTPTANYDAEAQVVIQVKTLKNKAYGWNGTFTPGIGTGVNPRYNAGLALNQRSKKSYLYGGYNYEHNKTYLDVDYDQYLSPANVILDNSHEERSKNLNTYRAGADFFPSNNSTVGVFFSGFSNNMTRTGRDNVTIVNKAALNDSSINVYRSGGATYQNYTSNIYFKRTLDTSGKFLLFNLDYIFYEKTPYDKFGNSYTSGNQAYRPNSNLRDSTLSKNRAYSFSTDYHSPFKNGNFDAGIKLTYTNTNNNLNWQYQSNGTWLNDPRFSNSFTYWEYISSAFVSYEKTIGKYSLTTSLRSEMTNSDGHQIYPVQQENKSNYVDFFPTLILVFEKDKNNRYSLSYKRSIQRPVYRDLNPYINYYSPYSYYSGNPKLLPQYDDGIDLTYTYKSHLNLGLQYNLSNNYIVPNQYRQPDNSTYFSSGNVKKVNLFGVSLNWNGTVWKFWELGFSSSLQYQQFNDTLIKNEGFTYNVDVKNSFVFKKGWSGEIFGNYTSSSPYGIYTLANGTLSGVGLGVVKTIMQGKGKLSFSLSDLFNTKTEKYSSGFLGIPFYKNDKLESRFLRLLFTYRFGNKNLKPKTERINNIEDLKSRING